MRYRPRLVSFDEGCTVDVLTIVRAEPLAYFHSRQFLHVHLRALSFSSIRDTSYFGAHVAL